MALFECVNTDSKGKISSQGFEVFVGAVGVSEADAKVAFDMIDTNNDGTLSQKELCGACAHYYLDIQDTPYKHFYGKYD